MAHEVRELVDGFRQLKEGIGPLLVNASHPRGHGCGRDEHGSGGLGLVPAACGPEFQDGHAIRGRIVRTPVRCNLGHAGILDPQFFP